LALVVAYLEDKPVYVFDEVAADQDPRFRAYFYETLLPELKNAGKTVIAVSHDDRYFHIADRVLLMEYGSLGELADPPAVRTGYPS
jgi:putative ATP-binding cassette transporter